MKPEVNKEEGGTTDKTRLKSQYDQDRSNNQYHRGKQKVDQFATPRTTFKR